MTGLEEAILDVQVGIDQLVDQEEVELEEGKLVIHRRLT